MTFDELLNLVSSRKAPDICIDSRLVEDGAVFIALKGTIYDGHDFIDQAAARGAKYIVCQSPDAGKEQGTTSCEIVLVKDSAEAAAILAQAGRGYPASKLTNLAVTGTNGKTTVAYLVRSVIRAAGQKCGLVGTIVFDTGLESAQADLTTPDCCSIADGQEQMVRGGAKYMVIEASSHALAQNRLSAINFKAAAFTNLAGDHLDYHKTKDEYLAAKTRLFTALPPGATAVLNKQSPEAEIIATQIRDKHIDILWYAVDDHADIAANVESMTVSGTNFVLQHSGNSAVVKTPLLGRYNVSNHLAAAGLCLAAGFDLDMIATGLSALEMVPGRLEKIDIDSISGDSEHDKRPLENPSVLIDYAHTDDALKNALSALKPFCKGTLYVVFGCGGDRDRTKRPRMARIAEQLADFVIVTSDNPRTEQPDDIISEIVAGFENPDSKTIVVEPDRKKAIEFAIKTAARDDIVLIAGKGHEDYQIIGTKKFDFSDKLIAQKCLGQR
ncbi:MAG: UDP-N-acetylmuramoyl-L-alanyl-D-glutamate--2,6-diaminopimelate ligase [Phycisphaerae bacterium]|nr:UDP-N-acetylmuramoyl-L-alanyl-D-glutamate--2,6-diaminopimelate ligase [Phycisphaerae bacterium]